jgi:hypothetical protein
MGITVIGGAFFRFTSIFLQSFDALVIFCAQVLDVDTARNAQRWTCSQLSDKAARKSLGFGDDGFHLMLMSWRAWGRLAFTLNKAKLIARGLLLMLFNLWPRLTHGCSNYEQNAH